MFDFINIVQFFCSAGCVQFTAKFMNDENGYKCTYTYNGFMFEFMQFSSIIVKHCVEKLVWLIKQSIKCAGMLDNNC